MASLASTPAFAAYPWVTCRANFVVTYKLDGPGSCTPPERRPSRLVKAFHCETGALCSGTVCPCSTLITPEWIAFGGYPVGNEPCEDDPPPPVTASTCGEEELPKQCSDTPRATMEPAGLLGDPIDMTSGILKLTPTDVDLGGGLSFRRHYASSRTVVSAMGRGWRHSLDWRLVRQTVAVPSGGTIPVLMIFRPLDKPIVFAGSYDGLSYATSPTESRRRRL